MRQICKAPNSAGYSSIKLVGLAIDKLRLNARERNKSIEQDKKKKKKSTTNWITINSSVFVIGIDWWLCVLWVVANQ